MEILIFQLVHPLSCARKVMKKYQLRACIQTEPGGIPGPAAVQQPGPLRDCGLQQRVLLRQPRRSRLMGPSHYSHYREGISMFYSAYRFLAELMLET
jgi:hypothetical protein